MQQRTPTKKEFEKPERPRLRRRPDTGPQWLVLEPARLALVGGSFFATVALAYQVVRQWRGATLGIFEVAIGVGLTFVVSYAATGCFVWFLLWVAERELEPEEVPAQDVHRASLTDTTPDEAAGAAEAPTEAPAEAPEPGEEEGA